MEKYLIFEKTSETNRKYVYQIGKNSIFTTEDIGNGIEFYDKETAMLIAKYLTKRNETNKRFYVLSMITEVKVIENEENNETNYNIREKVL